MVSFLTTINGRMFQYRNRNGFPQLASSRLRSAA
jgi:hypothetical protein